MFKRTRISRISRTKGRVSQTMQDEYFLIRGEYHEFYHPDGIRAIRMRSARYPPQGFVEFVEFVFSKIKR